MGGAVTRLRGFGQGDPVDQPSWRVHSLSPDLLHNFRCTFKPGKTPGRR